MGKNKDMEIYDYKNEGMTIGQGEPLPIGVSFFRDRINFSVNVERSEGSRQTEDRLELLLYPKADETACIAIEFPPAQRVGNIWYMSVSNINPEDYEYNFSYNGEIFTDERAGKLVGREIWGKRELQQSDDEKKAQTGKKPQRTLKTVPREKLRGAFVSEEFDWNKDVKPDIPFEDTIIYRMHVRGFTKHESSGVKHRGTFKGIAEKLSYLKSLGVTYVELMPAYEFDEILDLNYPVYFQKSDNTEEVMVNYWGYSKAYYFAPKQAYASGNATLEFKELVQALHREGIELGMEFYFAPGTSKHFITDCLRYWLLNYHVDGFHINTEIAPADIIAADPMLASVKLFASDWYGAGSSRRNIAVWNRGFMCDVRKFLKGDEGMVESFVSKVLDNPKDNGVVNFLADHNCMTVKDMVSYDKKHNEANGENNNDGENYNFSWNCGAEGDTKKRKVLDCRLKQMKNAWVMLLCSQGIPMIMAGDEFGRTQSGNNNPYCQDNEISWLNWKLLRSNRTIFEFVKQLLEFRKGNRILHMPKRLMQMDSMSCGYPDVSLHGIRAWYPDTEYHNRHTGLLFCGKYARQQEYIYIAFNMYWEEQLMALPGLEPGLEWELFLRTDKGTDNVILEDRRCSVPARSVCIFVSKKAAKTTNKTIKQTGVVKK